jgi:hypothetical protein
MRLPHVRAFVLALLAACGSASKKIEEPAQASDEPAKPVFAKKQKLSDFEKEASPKLLDIDWDAVRVTSTQDALALWARIAPTGADWEEKLDEVPDRVERLLALALLEGDNFTCTPPPPKQDCAPRVFDVKEPSHKAGFGDPCLRRLLALWAIDKIDDSDLPRLHDHLAKIVAIPLPESELVATVLIAIPENDPAYRLDLLATAWKAGQTEVVNGAVGKLDEPHIIEAATKYHIDGALDILSAEGHRAVYLGAVTDEQLGTRARTRAMQDLAAIDPTLPSDVKTALVKATTSKDCAIAATAARLLQQAGDKRFVPTKRGTTPDKLMRSLCVLASYEQQQGNDEPTLLATYVAKTGLERVTITYDPLGEDDSDGDGDPHTVREVTLVPRDQLALPELDDLIRAFKSCAGTTCKSDDREFRFVFKNGLLQRLELVERPPCPKP